VCHGAVYFRATCVSVCHLRETRSARKCRRKFRDERVPSKQITNSFALNRQETKT
jgi:hypothetical protein